MKSKSRLRVRSHARRGVSSIWALSVLTLLTAIIAAITAQHLHTRRWLDRRQSQIQTEWLARAGVELAVTKLLHNPDTYKGESFEMIPTSRVRIEVSPDPAAANTFLVTCEAHLPTDARTEVMRSIQRRYRRIVEKDQVRLEIVIAAAEQVK